tara:strand:- start:144 stop:1166 length:1023 start_codon:yes stop_codon:yes gene_type:complete
MKELLIFLISFLSIKTVSDAGSFKKINPHYNGECIQIEGVSGPEDIVILDNGLALISSDNRRLTLKGNPVQGHIFSYNLKDDFPKVNRLTDDINFEFHPHGISVFKDFDKIVLFVVNHRLEQNTIEIFHLINNKLFYQKTIYDDLLNSPNDLVAINENQFYVTNDHGSSSDFNKLIEDYLQLSRSNVLYYNGEKFKVVINKLKYANGINLSKDGTKLFLAETIGKSVSVYNRDLLSSELLFEQRIYLNSGVDNIELDNNGNLWIGSHPQLLKFIKHSKNREYNSPSQVIKVKLSKDEYIVDEVYLDDGSEYSGSSVAAPYENILLIGAVFEDYFLLCQNN